MKHFNMILVLLFSQPVFSQSADEILEKNAEAVGSKYAQDLKTYITHGKMVALNGMTIGISSYVKEGNRIFIKQTFKSMGIEMTVACDGTDCYSNDQMLGLRLVEGQEKESYLMQNDFISSNDWKELYPKREFQGEETFEGTKVYKVRQETKAGLVSTNYYSSETYLLLKSDFTMESPMGKVNGLMIYDKYRDVYKGFLMPVKIRTKIMNIEATLTLDEIEINIEIPDSKFALPEGLK